MQKNVITFILPLFVSKDSVFSGNNLYHMDKKSYLCSNNPKTKKNCLSMHSLIVERSNNYWKAV